MTEGLTAIVFARSCEARSKDGEGRSDDEKQCTKLPRAKYKIIANFTAELYIESFKIYKK
jgi:hypothetical protein